MNRSELIAATAARCGATNDHRRTSDQRHAVGYYRSPGQG